MIKLTNYKPYTGQVPFLKENGFMTSIFNERWMKDIVDWKDNYVFEAKLVFDRFDYKKNWVVVDPVDGREYTVFPSEVMDLLHRGDVLQGEIVGKWTFMKRGACFGIRYIGK